MPPSKRPRYRSGFYLYGLSTILSVRAFSCNRWFLVLFFRLTWTWITPFYVLTTNEMENSEVWNGSVHLYPKCLHVVRMTAQTIPRLFQGNARDKGRCLLLDLRWESGFSRMYGLTPETVVRGACWSILGIGRHPREPESSWAHLCISFTQLWILMPMTDCLVWEI